MLVVVDHWHGELRRIFPDGRQAVLSDLYGDRARLSIGPLNQLWFNEQY